MAQTVNCLPFNELCPAAQPMVLERLSLSRFVLLTLASEKFLETAQIAAITPQKYEVKIDVELTSITVQVDEKRQLTWRLNHVDFWLFEEETKKKRILEKHTTLSASPVEDSYEIGGMQFVVKEDGKGNLLTDVRMGTLAPALARVDAHLRKVFANPVYTSLEAGNYLDLFSEYFAQQKVFDRVVLSGAWRGAAAFNQLRNSHIKLLEMGGFLWYDSLPIVSFGPSRTFVAPLPFQSLNIDTFYCEETNAKLSTANAMYIGARVIRLEKAQYSNAAINEFIRAWSQDCPRFRKFEKLVLEVSVHPVLDAVLEGCNAEVWNKTKRSGWLADYGADGKMETIWDCRKGWDIERKEDGALATYMSEPIGNKFRITFFVWKEKHKHFLPSKGDARFLLVHKQIERERLIGELREKRATYIRNKKRLDWAKRREGQLIDELREATDQLTQLEEQMPLFEEFEKLSAK